MSCIVRKIKRFWKQLVALVLALLIGFAAWTVIQPKIPPLEAGTTTFYVGDSGDDAWESPVWGMYTTHTETRTRSYTDPSAVSYHCGGLRFPDATIPQGAVITSANFSGYVADVAYDDINCIIYGNDVDNAQNFTDNAHIINDTYRPRTSATVSWVQNSLGSGWKEKTGLEGVVEEIVGQDGWSSGNAIVLLFIANTDVDKKCYFYSYDQSSDYAAKLEISWVGGTGDTFYSTSSDGHIYTSGTNYTTVRDTSSGTVVAADSYSILGQNYFGDTFTIFRLFLIFDTSFIPDTYIITSANLSIYGRSKTGGLTWNITVQNGQSTYPHDPLAASDYDRTHYSGDGGTFLASDLSIAGYNTIQLTALSWINKTGKTKFCLRSSQDIDDNEPTGSEQVSVWMNEQGEGYIPKLTVIYRPPLPPKWTQITWNSTVATADRKSSVEWEDESGLSGHIFGCNVTGTFTNDTWSDPWAGTPTSGWSNVTKTLPPTPDTVIQWQVWVNNTIGLWNSTGIQSFIVHSEKELYVHYFDETYVGWVELGEAPHLHDDMSSKIYAGTPAQGKEGWFHFEDPSMSSVPLRGIVFKFYAEATQWTGAWVKVYVHDGSSEHDLGTVYVPVRKKMWYEIDVTSVINSWAKLNNARVKFEIVTSGAIYIYKAKLRWYFAPYPMIIGTTTPKAEQDCKIYVKWKGTISIQLSSYAVNHNASGDWLEQNITGSLSGYTDWSNETITLPSSTISVVAYQFWANDTDDGWDTTEIQYIYLMWKHFDSAYLQKIGDAGKMSLCHSLGRKSLYGKNSGRYWVFYYFTNETDGYQVYSSSADGIEWTEPVVFRTGCEGGNGKFYAYYEDRDGNDYVHYQYCHEDEFDSLYWRRGLLNANGSITWSAEEQMVVAGGGDLVIAPNGIAITPSGHVFMGYCWKASGSWLDGGQAGHYPDMHMNVTLTTNTNGTWQTYGGYPKEVSGDYVHITTTEATIWAMDEDFDVYVVMSTAGWSVPSKKYNIQGRMIDNNVLQSIENITIYPVFEARCFSAFSVNKNVHVAYRGNATDTFYYCWRNSTSGEWDVQDETITSYLTPYETPAPSFSYIVIGFDEASNEIYANWFTREDESAWLVVRNDTAWSERTRLLNFEDHYIDVDPNIVTTFSHGHDVLYSFALRSASGNLELWSYLYVTAITSIELGWNNFIAHSCDVGHTLAEINASVWSDGIEFTVITLTFANGTHLESPFIRGYQISADVQIESTSDVIWIYCTVAGEWKHEY